MTILVIQKKGQSSWKSCQGITSNLAAAYQTLGKSTKKNVELMEVDQDLTQFDGVMLAQEIIKKKPEGIAFIDHYPHPAAIIKALKSIYEKREEEAPLLVFHIFGDFVLNCLHWKAVEEELKFFKVQFICASHKQAELLDSFLLMDEDECKVIPFPISDIEYFYSDEIRDRARKKYKWNNEFIFLYTGRLSYQKNITTLLRSFSTFSKNFDSKAKLILAGPMDDLAIPYLGKEALPGTFYFHWEESIREYGLDDKVNYLGNLSKEELFELYNGSDCYISLSSHNDEDYGMSPAEALSTGLPCILSQWGGFISFAQYFPALVNLVEVENQGDRNLPQIQASFKAMASQFIQGSQQECRETTAIGVHDVLGIHAIGKKLEKTFSSLNRRKFKGFNVLFYKLSAQFENTPQSPFRAAGGGYSHFYNEVYGNYSKRS